jgi:hypothetical protein
LGTSQHAKFLDRLRGSKRGQWAFAYWLSSQGYWVTIPPLREAPTAAEHRNYRDNGDVFAWEEGGPRLRIEVKTLGVTFTGRRDWPYREVFVASVDSVRRAIGDVFAWVSVSDDLGAAAIVEERTSDEWYIRTCPVSNTGNVESNFACPLDLVKFVKLGG